MNLHFLSSRINAPRGATVVLGSLLISLAPVSAQPAPAPYQPAPVAVPGDASYVRSDGSVYIVGNDGMEEMLNKLNELFAKTHPGIKFTMQLKGSSTGIGGLTAGVSAFAPMGREAWPTDVSGFREAFGYLPLDIRVGYDAYTRPQHKNPPAIYVNAKNPLAGLTTAQITRIFTEGAAKGDITYWSQLGLKGEWVKRAIHLYGPPDEGGLATSLRTTLMEKHPFRHGYEALPKLADIVDAVAADPFGIALVGFFDAATVPGVKLVPLAENEGGPFASPSYDEVHAGRYPYSPYLHFYVNRAPGKPLDPFVREYLRLVLSTEGQAIIAAQKDSDEGYVPLDPGALAAELAKLE